MTIFYVDLENGNNGASGIDWNTAWRDLYDGPTSARINPGDTIRVSKSFGPVKNVGSGLFRYNTWYTPLSSEATGWFILHNCNTLWNGADITNVTKTLSTTHRVESACNSFAPNATFTIGKIAYASGFSLDLSQYEQISLWMRSSVNLNSGDLVFGLTSDSLGNNWVNSGILSQYCLSNVWNSWTIDNKTLLSSNISGFALYATRDFGASTISIDNIIVAPARTGVNTFTHNSLISPVPETQYNPTGWYSVGGFDSSGIYIDNGWNTIYPLRGNAPGSGHCIPSGWFPIYRMEPTNYTRSNTVVRTSFELSVDGTPLKYITYEGGWNPQINQKDGVTFLSQSMNSVLSSFTFQLNMNSKSYINIYNFGFVRGFNIGTNTTTNVISRFINWKNIYFNNVSMPFFGGPTTYNASQGLFSNWIFDFVHASCFFGAFKCLWRDSYMDKLYIVSSHPITSTYNNAILRSNNLYINELHTYCNYVWAISPGSIFGNIYINKAIVDTITPLYHGTSNSQKCGETFGINKIINGINRGYDNPYGYPNAAFTNNYYGYKQPNTIGGNVAHQTGVSVDGITSSSWKMSPVSTAYCSYMQPMVLPAYQCYVNSGTKVDVTCWMRRDNLGIFGTLALRSNDNNTVVVDNTGWLSGFNNRRRLTVLNINNYSGLNDFPLYIPIKNDYLFGESCKSHSGIDVCFTKQDGITVLDYEQGYYSVRQTDSGVNAHYWVRTDINECAPTYLYVYYGATGVPVDYSNATGVWGNNYIGVWHLSETGFPYRDSTINGKHFVSGNPSVYKTSDGPGQCSQFFYNNNQHYINAGNFVEHDPGNNSFAVEVLYRNSGVYSSSDEYVVYAGGTSKDIAGYSIRTGGGAGSGLFSDGGGTANDFSAQNMDGNLPSGYSWCWDASVLNRTTTQHQRYRNRNIVKSTSYNVALGNISKSSDLIVGSGFNGEIDEVRLSTNQRFDNWYYFQRDNLMSLMNTILWDQNDIKVGITGIIDTWTPITLTCYPQQDGFLRFNVEAWGGTTYNIFFDKIEYTQT